MATNDQDPGRSLEEQLASLDAMNSTPPDAEAEPDEGVPTPNPWKTTPPAPPFQPPPAQPPGYPPDFAYRPPPFPGGGFPGPPYAPGTEPAAGEIPGRPPAPEGSGRPFTPGPPPEEPEGYGPTAPTEAYSFGPMRPGPYGPPEDRPPAGGPVPGEPMPPPPPAGTGRPGFDAGPPAPPPPPGPAGPPPPGLRYSAPSFKTPPGDYAQPPAAPPQPQTADSLSSDMLLRGRRDVPAGGWRRVVYKASGGVIHPGESATESRRRELLAQARTPVSGGHYRVAVMSLKGGVGKTTTTVGLGATLASIRGDRVIAVDANPDRGTLSDKVRLESAATVRDLVNEHQRIQRYADVRAFTSQAPSRLEVLASDRDPAASEAFSEDDYRTVARVLENFYSICITDCGTGLLHSAMAGVLGLADQLILVSSPSVDGARSASATLDWLEAHQHGELVRGAVVVLSMVRQRSRSTVDIDRLQAHFESRCRAVVRIPYDAHLEEGAEVDLDQLDPITRDAYLTLAAAVADAFAWSR